VVLFAAERAEQLLLARLSVFAEGFGLDAAEAVCGFAGIEPIDVADLLGSLVDKSLVVAEPAGETLRYRLLETIREFAAEKLAQAGPGQAATTVAAHCAHFLSVAETAARHLTGPDQGRWLALLDVDQANLRRAAAHAAGDPDRTAQVLRFGVALRRYWMMRSRYAEPFALLVPVLERPEARADSGLFAAALISAEMASRFVDIVVALQLGEQAIVLARQLGDDRLLIESLAALSAAYYHAGQPDRGLPLAEEAMERGRELGDDVLRGRSLSMYLLLASDPADPARYAQLFTEAIAWTERSGDRFTNCQLHNNAGYYALNTGDIPAARAHLQQAAHVAEAIGASSHHVQVNLGEVLRLEGDPDGARSMFEAALRISRRNGELHGLAYASSGLACVAADLGNWHRAGELHGAAQALLDRTGQRWQQGEARQRQASLDQVRAHLGQEQFDRTYAHGTTLSLEQALDVALAEYRLCAATAERNPFLVANQNGYARDCRRMVDHTLRSASEP
jgi:tetratricopeptide (TPR) repeat protein